MKVLLKAGGNVNQAMGNCTSPIYVACANNHNNISKVCKSLFPLVNVTLYGAVPTVQPFPVTEMVTTTSAEGVFPCACKPVNVVTPTSAVLDTQSLQVVPGGSF